MRPDLRPALPDPVVLEIARRDIAAGDIEPTLAALNEILEDPARAKECLGRLVLVFEGWDDDPRELFEIEAVRGFVQSLDAEWPWWFAYLNQGDDVIKLIESCLAPAIEIAPGLASIDLEVMKGNLARHFASLARLFERHGWPQKDLETISEGVVQLIRNAFVQDPEAEGYR